MKLPKDWYGELRAIDGKIQELQKGENQIGNSLEKEISRVKRDWQKENFPKLSILRRQIEELEKEKETFWENIRKKGIVVHPPQRKRFTRHEHAAEVLAAYWVGEQMDREGLVQRIICDTDRIRSKAYTLAKNLTAPNSSERAYVDRAYEYLWGDNERG